MSSAVCHNRVTFRDFLVFALRHLFIYAPLVFLFTLPIAMVWTQAVEGVTRTALAFADRQLAAGGLVCPNCTSYFHIAALLARLSVFVLVSGVMIAVADRRRSPNLASFLVKMAVAVCVFAAFNLYFVLMAFAAFVALHELHGVLLLAVAAAAAPLVVKFFQYLLAAPVIVFEGARPFDALDRSSWLMHRHYAFAAGWLVVGALACGGLLLGAHGLLAYVAGSPPELAVRWRAMCDALHWSDGARRWPMVDAQLPDVIRSGADLLIGLVMMSVLLALYWAIKRFDDRGLWAPSPPGVDRDWREKAITALQRQGVREQGAEVTQNRRWRYAASVAPVAAITLAVASPALLWAVYEEWLTPAQRDVLARLPPATLRWSLGQPATYWPWFMTLGDLMVMAILVVAAIALFAGLQANGRLRRRLAMEERGVHPTTEISRAHGPPVFYLRSFNFDRTATRPPLFSQLVSVLLALVGISRVTRSPEMALVMAIPRRVPVIAIGRPGERSPPPGVLRFYATDEIWKAEVEAIVPTCQMVIWVTGYTEGLKWEVEHLLTHSRPERLVLWNHASIGPRSQRDQEWRQFLDAYAHLFPKGLPENGARCAFVVFDSDWTPIGVPSRAFPLVAADLMRVDNGPILGFRSIVRRRLVS